MAHNTLSRLVAVGISSALVCTSALAQTPPVVVANPVSGTADFGVAGGSQAIANVTTTDTVNGSPVVLGSGGNAVLTKVPPWPTGLIGLNTGTGAVSTFVNTPEGPYVAYYQLCAATAPTDCASATITVTVISPPVLVANPDTGTADSGISSQPIVNVTLNDTVNGGPVVLTGPGTNAQIRKYQNIAWPNGIGLNPSNGAVSTQISSQNGPYYPQYQLCDLNVPAQCVTGNVTVTIISASIIPNPVTCVGTPGSLQCNVVTGDGIVDNADTVDGEPVTLPQSNNGNPVNAQLTIEGSAWPSGIVLNSGTGAVTASRGVAPGTYSLQYKLCDLNVPANCAANTLTLDIETNLVVNAQSGTATLGVNSTPIKNVVSGDTINDVQCRLQTSPNCTVSASGTWPAGIALNTTTGAVTVASTVKQGFYDTMFYTVCSVNSPTDCQSAPVTIEVDASITVVSVAGSSVVGISAVAIGNVLINDVVNGAQATLLNATVTQGSGWPAGISLNTSSGIAVVTVASTVPANTYPKLPFMVCEKAYPSVCGHPTATVSVTAAFNEVSVSPYMTGDIEFDWARDGRYCSTCNFGSTNSQVNWTDRDSNLWVNYVNPVTGMFTPSSGRQTNVTMSAFFWQAWGNGPEWAFSTPVAGQDPVSQLVYTGFAAGSPPNGTYEYAESEFATQTGNSTGNSSGIATWQPYTFPGAYAPPQQNTVLPEATQCATDSFASAVFENLLTPTQMFTETLSTATGTQPVTTPFGALANGMGERFVACAHDASSPYPQSTRWLTFQGDVTIGDNVLQQEFWYDLDNPTQQATQLTFDPTTKQRGIMFKAPDFPDTNGNAQYILMTVAADQQIEVFLQTGTNSNGSPIMTLVNTIYSPDPEEPYMFDPKAFVNCTPQCVSYVVMGLGAVAESQQSETEPNGIGVTALNPNSPFFEVLVPANKEPLSQRLDPKVFITDGGPVVYYDLLTTATPTVPYNDLGIYMINMALGQPVGNCVGWSAYDGPNNTYNSNNPAPNYCTQPTSNYPIN